MRILSIHNSYQIRGGEDESRQLEEDLLRKRGHEVTTYEETNNRISELHPFRVAIKTIWSSESYYHVKQNLRSKVHNVVHVQNFFPLISPSVYYAAKSEGVPVIQTLRNYRLLCPNALLFRSESICEECMGKFIPYPGVIHRCYRESRIESAGVAAMLSVHRALKTWDKMVNVYITLSEFSKRKFIKGGMEAEKIFVKPNFIYPDPGNGKGNGGYALYVGRLSIEKGLDILLKAWKYLGKEIPLKIVGDGPLAKQVMDAAEQIPQIELLGRRTLNEVYDLIGEAACLVFPSKWYETFGRVGIEAFAKGTPVIGANLGAISELVDHNRTGLCFQTGSAEDLAAKVEYLFSNPALLAQMRVEAREEFEKKYTADRNYQKLMEIYEHAKKT